MAIDTKLNIDTSIKSRSDTITPNVRQDGGQMDRFMSLADALQDFNPALKEFVVDKTKEKGNRKQHNPSGKFKTKRYNPPGEARSTRLLWVSLN